MPSKDKNKRKPYSGGWKEAVKESKEKKEKGKKPLRPGVCICGNDSAFHLRFENHRLLRRCIKCWEEIEV